ncbi:MAG: metallophosphatase family protein [Deltaproteobacteria bacterium]|nr:metallophosphatase family protein [Deltaproteobacteria bacterium]
MRYLIVSDMHGNWDAFDAVLRHVKPETFDVTLVLGDLVGYGAAPNRVVDAVRRLPGESICIRGNHDKVVAGIDDGSNFNFAALTAARWTAERLEPENMEFIQDLPQGPVEIAPSVFICHGSPLDEDTYIFSNYDAYEVFEGSEAWLTFFGHTHIPSLFTLDGNGIEVGVLRGRTGTIELDPKVRYLINPGSVGQPRDRDPKASYLIFDSEKQVVNWHRLAYPIEIAQKRIHRAELPRVLADRLAMGV